MKASTSLWLGIGLIGTAVAASAAPTKISPEQSEFFEKKIRPILSQNCYKCHSEAEKVKGGLIMDSRDALLKGGDSGPGLVPGKPDKSLIIKAVRYEDKDLAMPPKGDKLSDEDIEALVNWVKMGAPDPREGKTAAASTLKVDMEKAKQHWAYNPVKSQEVPKVKDTAKWVKSPIDSFVLAKLQEKGLQPSQAADKRTLIRRATYDLTGLPPTPQEVDAFLADNSKDAFAKVVDRLLASPRYGEHWGRHWLDIARYADTSGDRLGGNRKSPLYPYAWTYRDYVIKSFNDDLPYDQFIVQQIAGDRLPEAEKDKSIIAAVGFLTVGKGFMNNDNDVLDDRIDVVTKGLMGLTASCARCHDHKFDPIPTKDYYSLHGIFANSREPKEEPLIVEPKDTAEYQDFLKQTAKVEEEVAEFQKSESARIIGGLLDRSGDYMMLVHDEIKPGKRAAEIRLLAKKRNLDGYMFEVWADTLRKISSKKDPVFTPWFRYAALGDSEFAQKAPEITADLADSKLDVDVNPAIAKAIVAAQPKTLKDVADIYTKLMGEVQKTVGAEAFDYRKVSDKRRGKGIDTAARMTDQDMEAIRQFFFADSSPVEMDARQMNRLLGNQFSTRENAIRSQSIQLEMTHPGSPVRAMALQDAPRPKDSRIMIRGEARNLGAVAPRQFLEILAGDKREPFKDGSGRLELAKSIASRDNPLTARVFVNRVWKEHFGEAIVRTPSDFGMRSEPPTHPEMLDYLAAAFMENGWSVKKLHRQIMLSSTYQQDSRSNEKALAADPTNQLLWRMNIR
ncbi:MAG TPA: PSD1 and planctomycete cytochrome C domain-containing protein, partial [Roseimicrobium sp.]|nr:PSD1 and planctomycete cytochrome C domain-containing protein [Roseimicrobium sp.]